MSLSIIPSDPNAANAITTFLILAIPSLFCPIAINTHHRMTMANPHVIINVINICVSALDIHAIALSPSLVLPSLVIHLPMNGILVLRAIPHSHLHIHDSDHLHDFLHCSVLVFLSPSLIHFSSVV